MNRFFTNDIQNDQAILGEEDAYHLKNVLRARIGEEFEICDGVAHEYVAELVSLDKKSAVLNILREITVEREPHHRYCICQCIPKGKKTDDVVRHCTELGMSDYFPVISERVNVKNIDEYDKTDRLQRVADEAAKQSKRIIIPTINKPIKFSQLVTTAPQNAIKIIAWEEEHEISLRKALSNVNNAYEVYIIVGPEGGLSSDEVALAKENGWISVTLGKRILRTETAPLTLLSAVSYQLEDLE